MRWSDEMIGGKKAHSECDLIAARSIEQVKSVGSKKKKKKRKEKGKRKEKQKKKKVRVML